MAGPSWWARWPRGRGLAGRARRYLPSAGLPRGQRRQRVATSAGALAAAAVLAGAPVAAGGAAVSIQAPAGAAGLVALAAGLLGWIPGIGWGVALLAVDYGAALAGRHGIDPAAPLEAAGLLLVAELAAWSLESRTWAPDTAGVTTWRLRRLAVLEAGAVICGAIVLAAASLPARGGTALGAVGVTSAVSVLVLAAAGLRRLGRRG